MADLGFGPVVLLSPAIHVYMAGSHRRLNAYMFTKAAPPPLRSSRSTGQRAPRLSSHAAEEGELDVGGGSSSSKSELPSLLSAAPFDSSAVIEALARMSGEGSAGQVRQIVCWEKALVI